MAVRPTAALARAATAATAAALVALVIALPSVADASGLVVAGHAPLTVTGHAQLADRLHEYTVSSPALEREATIRVHLPTAYEEAVEQRWPLALLLHGRSETGQTWSDQVDLDQFDDMIFVMPDGGLVGWYTDWVDDAGFDPQRWETFHIREVLPWADRTFRVAPGRSQRFIAGDSMGGFGTMKYAARYPDRFSGAAELSGFVDILYQETSGVIGVDGQSYQTYQVPPGSIFGDRATQEVIWRGSNPVDLAANLEATDLVLRHGNGLPGDGDGGPDAGEAAIRLTGVSFHDRLVELGIDHLWDDYGNGVHTWPYWERGLQIALPRWQAIADADSPDPVPFTYSTIESVFDVYGFDVVVDRDVIEFATLADASPTGFELSGSGSATVRTPAWYVPGATYTLAIDGAENEARADEQGRLTTVVDLGPSHTAQQFTPVARAQQAIDGDGYFTTATVTVSLAEAPPPPPDDADPAATPEPSMPATGGGFGLAAVGIVLAAQVKRRRASTAASWSCASSGSSSAGTPAST